jgi:hypothetical protein
MIRTTRAQAGVDRVVRRAVDVPVDLGPRERELYALSTDLLRSVMRDSGDTMRRRSLALRLTASPFSMGTTALRMAERHPDPRVRSVLGEVGHLAMDIDGSARENKALEITRTWLKEHGRVLIFTQHTDTVTGLLRRMGAEGLTARSFHGSMSAGERAATIAAFRSGDAPVMISTDAGAEGQNLQFCNCVLNFDLPWNPMRIEQRIGRVDRLTQPKDEVFIANLYAQRTVDESVYRLLAEKLRMFELLFGQVTTILGELDDAKSATFEARVLEALFADSDTKMEGLLAQLGSELAHARESASALIAADSGLSNWMASAFEHRKELSKAGTTELVPEVSERARMRQRRVQTWTRKVLKALDAELLHDTGDGEGAFLTAQFDKEFASELGGRTLIHLAFDRLGLEQHPDAELCAVGSPVFDELLGLLRMRGDMHATVPVIPDDIGPSPYRHASTLTLLRRRLIPSGSWSGQATFRATVGESETTEHLITADINGHNQQRLPRRPLQDGESLPPAFDTPSKVIAHFERSAAGQLESLRRKRSEQVETDQALELSRIKSGYTAQIAEATHEDRERLTRALSSEERRLNRRPDVRARAKMLALTLDEDDWVVEETWAGPSGTERGLVYEWGLDEPLAVESDASSNRIRVLALCSAAHWVDESETTRCKSCDHVLCSACGDEAVFVDCPLCGLSSCGTCRDETGGLCLRCGSPERTPDLDDAYTVAWSVNGGATLLVGERVTNLVRPGEPTLILVPADDVADPHRTRMRSYAQQNDLPLDSGLVLRDLTGHPEAQDQLRTRLNTSATVDIEVSPASTSGSAIDSTAIADIPDHPEVVVRAENEFLIDALLQRLRYDAPPPAPPATMVTHRARFTDIYLEPDGLVREVAVVGDDGTLVIGSVESTHLQWVEPSTDDATLAAGEIGDLQVSLERRNEAVLITTHTNAGSGAAQQWIACPEGRSLAHQLGCFEYLQSAGTSGGRLGKLADEVLSIATPFPSPTECDLVDRTITPVAELVELDSDDDLVPADEATLEAFDIHPDNVAAQRISALPYELSRRLLDQATRPFTTALCNGLEVVETWKGHGRATHKYRTFDGEPMLPKLDDGGFRVTDFGVCRDSHFYGAGAAARCGACQSWACRACDEIDHQASLTCPGCSTSVCRRCLFASHTVPHVSCLLCDDHACSDCGRDPTVLPCSMCKRDMCASCRTGDVCPACNRLATANEAQTSSLPEELALAGATVLIGADDDATVVLLNRGRAFEQAIVRDGAIHRWIAFDRNTIDSSYRLRLSASRSVKRQVVPVVHSLDPEPTITAPHAVIQSERKYQHSWSIAEVSSAGRAALAFGTPDGDLALLALDDFPTLARIPEAVATKPDSLRDILTAMANPSTAAMIIRWERFGHDQAITADGISELTLTPSGNSESLAPWIEAVDVPPWVVDAWDPAPSVHVYAKVRETEAVIVELASLLALGVRTAHRSEWYAINASDNAPAATMLSRWMGLGDADEVSVFTDPRKLRLSHVMNAGQSTLHVEPLGALGRPHTHADVTLEALAAWMPTANVTAPQLRPLPGDLYSALRQSMAPLTPRSGLEIGAHIRQLVTVEGGHQWQYERKLAAGQTDARRINDSTGHVLDSGVIDREGHFAVDYAPCAYCGGRTCRMCVDALVPCGCCAAPICKRCTQSPHSSLLLCPACVATRPPTRSEAREHGRLLLTRRMLIGTDIHHTVVFEQAKNEWTCRGLDGTKQPVTEGLARQFLDEQLAGSSLRGE